MVAVGTSGLATGTTAPKSSTKNIILGVYQGHEGVPGPDVVPPLQPIELSFSITNLITTWGFYYLQLYSRSVYSFTFFTVVSFSLRQVIFRTGIEVIIFPIGIFISFLIYYFSRNREKINFGCCFFFIFLFFINSEFAFF